MAYASELQEGNIFSYKKEPLCKVLNRSHVQPGKGGAYINIVAKNCITKATKNYLLSVSETVDIVELSYVKFIVTNINIAQKTISLMNYETFENQEINCEEDIRNYFLEEGGHVFFAFAGNQMIDIKYNQSKVKVLFSNASGHIVLNNCNQEYLMPNLPSYIESGDVILLDLTNGIKYVKRVLDK